MLCVVGRSWLSVVRSTNDRRRKRSSGCVIELFANRPTHKCYDNAERVKGLIVPLVKSDVSGELVMDVECVYRKHSVKHNYY